MAKIKRESVLVTPEDIKPTHKFFEVVSTSNPGAERLPNGDIILYVRVTERLKRGQTKRFQYSPRSVSNKGYKIKVEKFSQNKIKSSSPMAIDFKDETMRLKYISHFRRVYLSKDGFKVKKIDEKPSFYGLAKNGEFGVEDARLTFFHREKRYAMTFVSLSRARNVSTSLALSNDCVKWARKGIIFREQNKDVVLFPEKINGWYAAFNRPSGDFQFSLPNMNISFSKDLIHWGGDKEVVLSHKDGWDSGKTGAGTQPIKTKNGWLEIYHGVNDIHQVDNKFHKKKTGRKYVSSYCAGAALFDLEKPSKIIAKSPKDKPLFCPTHKYEKKGFVENVVFPCGAVIDEDKENILIYSGGADRVTTVKKLNLEDIFKYLKV